jgi:hypothetical protein
MTPQPQQFDAEAFAAVLASKCQTGVLESLAASDESSIQRAEALAHPSQFIQHVRTKDEHDEINPIKSFPDKPYIPYLFDLFTKKIQSIFFIAKSRQIMLTWLCCVYALWLAKSIPHRLIFLQSKKEEDAANLVFSGGRTGKNWDTGRISFIEKHLPWWLQEGADMIRSYTPSLVISDEAAFQPEFGSAYTAMLPIAKQGGMLIAISSANPGPFGEVATAC